MDSLFIIDRYMGSDEESYSEPENARDTDVSERKTVTVKETKKHKSSEKLSQEDNSSESNETNVPIESSYKKKIIDNSFLKNDDSFSKKRKIIVEISDEDIIIEKAAFGNNSLIKENGNKFNSSEDIKIISEKNIHSAKTNDVELKIKSKKNKKQKFPEIQTESSSDELNVSDMSDKNVAYKRKKENSTVLKNNSNFSNKRKKCTTESLEDEDVILDSSVYDSNTLSKENFDNFVRVEGEQFSNESSIDSDRTVSDTEKDVNSKNVKDKSEENKSMPVTSDVENFCTIGQVQQKKSIKLRHALPYWLSNPTYIGINLQEKETHISELHYLDSSTKINLQKAGIDFLFPVQLAVIPWLMQNKEQNLLVRPSDICVSAPTGSGKTLAFVIPIVQSLKDRVVSAIRALVVLPVNELAIQVYKVFETYVRGTDIRVALLTGQKSFIAEQNALVKTDGQKIKSLVDIVVTTPGRIYDHIYKTKGFCLKRLRYLVLDEADRMLDEIQQGWLKQVEEAVFNKCNFSNCICLSQRRVSHEPSSAYNFGLISQPLQKLLYSATLTLDPEQLHSLSLYKPKLFTASSSSSSSSNEPVETCVVPSGLSAFQIVCDAGTKPIILSKFIKDRNFKRVLCFTETIDRAHRLHLILEEMGLLQVREISSHNTVIQRKIVLEQFSMGKVNILVCSDLVARGLDIEDIDCVISYDIPKSIKMYVHRIGRTARAGKTGAALSLVTEDEVSSFKKMLKSIGIKMPETINVNSEDLKPLIHCFETALVAADAKLKKEKKQHSKRPSKKQVKEN